MELRNILIYVTLLTFFVTACDEVKQKTKETINKSGETIGQTATEFFEGISEGVDKTLQCEITLSEELKSKGLKTGKFSIQNDTSGGTNNLLVLYIIFEKDFKGTISAKAFDKNGLEIGRSKIEVENKAGEASYYDFLFDKRTYIESKSKISIE
ncbi:MAG TPA: hypothetical protein VIK89_13380 [Cytophagaceae bacterium]